MNNTIKAKRVWLISEIYYPVKTSTGYYMTEIAEHLALKGLDVHAICTGSTYNVGEVTSKLPENEICNGVSIHRVFVGDIDKNNFIKRVLRLFLSSYKLFFRLLSLVRPGDDLLVVTNPAFLILMMPYVKWRKKISYSIIVHDIFPENLVAINKISANSVLYKCLKIIFDKAYSKSRLCISIGRDMSDVLATKIGSMARVTLIPIWAENQIVHSLDKQETNLVKQLNLEGKFVFEFAGNLGHAQGIENLLEAIALLDNPNMHFLFIGGGAKYNTIADFAKNRSNISLIRFMDRSLQNDFLNACDIGIVTLADGMYGLGVPSKSYNIMAAGKPILMIGDSNSEIALCVEEYQLGWVVEPGNPQVLKEALESIYEHRDALSSIKNNARCMADTLFAKEFILDKYYQLFC